MVFQVLYTESALEELKALFEWSWEHHPGTSEQFADALFQHIDLLQQFPFMGTPVQGWVGVRRLLHTPFHIYYQVHLDRTRVDILHIWQTSRRPPTLPRRSE